MSAPSIVGFGGTLRDDSSTERLLREVLTACERRGATTRLFSGAILAAFPHYDPSDPSRTPAQIAFLDAVRGAGGVVIAAPGYHGGASGLVKNAIDLLQDLADAPLPHLDQRPRRLGGVCRRLAGDRRDPLVAARHRPRSGRLADAPRGGDQHHRRGRFRARRRRPRSGPSEGGRSAGASDHGSGSVAPGLRHRLVER